MAIKTAGKTLAQLAEELGTFSPYSKAKWYRTAETAALVRAALKEKFAGVKFSITSSVYSGGSSIRVRWTGGPSEQEVREVTWGFTAGTFNGMIDLYEYKQNELFGQPVRFSASFIFCERDAA